MKPARARAPEEARKAKREPKPLVVRVRERPATPEERASLIALLVELARGRLAPVAVRAYYRNSTDKQAQARTVESQRAPVGKLAAGIGEIASEHVDEATSGAAILDDRPGLRAMLAKLAPGDVVVAFALDRLTRSDDMIEQAAVFGAFQRARVRVVTVIDGEIDLASMAGRIMLAVKNEASAEERRKIRERTVNGKLRAIAEGRKPSGTTPFGLAWSKASGWSIDESAAAIVRDIYRRILDGESTEAIARALEDRTDARGRSVRWHKSRVWQTATSTAYRGAWLADKRRGLTVPVPAIVDEATWQQAQDVLGKRKRRGLDRTRHVYLAQGIARCGICGAPIAVSSASPATGQPAYYVCARRLRPARDADPCTLPRRRVDALDAAIWKETRRLLDTPDLLADAVAKLRQTKPPSRREADRLGAELRRLDRDENALADRFARGALSATALDVGLKRIATAREAAKSRLDEATRSATAAAEVRARLDEVAGSVAALRMRAATAVGSERQGIVRKVVEAIDVTDEAVEFSCVAPIASSRTEHETQTVRLAV